ncbi:cation:proton antiporter [Salarchaeum sp. JOR-1]|uniref:cation:proton antiporter domain-containing protein n=1 Tax=Salarchaeum sp. JOR-1 TaxID=2599399 RepID=UPI0011984CC1|nr:cation:proton antiporter [Salarchaeum sp. JOR-1]QDX40444.1 NAD-dependent epimerase/dehydratase family protein [Salarchaeum sp. JOR-1]
MSGSEVIPLVAAIIALGVGSQILSDKFQVPSVLFLILSGIVMGPEGFGLITPSALGLDALSAIVGLSVAIIVFEGAFHLKWEKLREAPGETLRLVTIGAVIALVGTSVAVHFLLGAAWDLSFLIGALLVATGPTVITPILEVVPVRDRVGAAMETEGVVNDVTAAILAIVVFEVVNPSHSSMGIVQSFASRLGAGIAIGALVAGIIWYLLRHVDLSAGGAVQNARLLVLAGALVAYAAANSLFSEAGIAAVATAGVLLGNADLPYEKEIETFKGDITLIVLSFVFIALAALLQFEDLIRLGLGGIGVAILVAAVIRPLAVFASTFGDRYTVAERAFMSAVGPRGIIPASVATLFAVQLQNAGQELAASTLVGTVFLVILLTVVFEGGPARQFAELLDIIPMRVIIVGGGTVGRALAERLEDRGENVVIIESDESIIELARNEGFTVHQGDGTDTEVLRKAGAEKAKIMVAATGDDDANLLVSQLADSKFDIETVIARANNPDNVDAFEDLGVRTVSSAMATAWGIDNLIERPALANWMTEIGRSGDVQEIEVTADDLVGMTIDELDEKLPNGCIIALVGRSGENEVPNRDRTLQKGDHLTFLGRKEAVREALEMCHPRE